MSISGISSSNYVAPAPLTQSTRSSSQVSRASDSDGDGDGDGGSGGKRAHKSHGGGQMQNALMQALQSLGLSMPQPTSSTTATPSTTSTTGTSIMTAASGTTSNPTTGATDGDGDSDGSSSATSSVKKDIGQFMHALFQAVKGESASSTPSAASTATDPKANFAAGLSALISQVSSGSAPADLQSAFAKVAADMQQSSSSAAGITSTGSSSSTSSPQATLQALLTQMQQNLGYGAASSSAAIGNLLSTQA
ncbi:MAG: hypothetical protein WCG50_11155 [Rhodoferax sp.]|uniref:hypothetical protein n=1 Tax=Rhodoferax sp. TaxID=50421 RepID=UPI00301590B0